MSTKDNCCCPEIPVEKPFVRPEGTDCPVEVKCAANPIVSVGTVVTGFATGSIELNAVIPDAVEDTADNRTEVASWEHPNLYPKHEN